MARTLLFLVALAGGPVLAASVPSDTLGLAPMSSKHTIELAPIDLEKAVEEDARTQAAGGPMRYGRVVPTAISFADPAGKTATAAWERATSKSGEPLAVLRQAFHAKGAVSVDLGFGRFFLPHGAQLYVTNPDRSMVRGPYTDADNPANGRFWAPLVAGETAILEVVVPESAKRFVELELEAVVYGYRDIHTLESPYAKSGSCNVDVACPQADNFRDQVNAVIRYTYSGSVCTGQLMNNTTGDRRRIVSSANHCLDSQTEADTVVAYWKYENPTCRAPRSSASGIDIPVNGNSIAQTGGATLLATHEPSDHTLYELRTQIPAAANPYWNGWDRREIAPSSTAVIHHPQGDEKRFAADFDPATLNDTRRNGVPGAQHWRIADYEVGTTEPGSSGSGLLNPEKRVIGVLSGGAAACASGTDVDNDGDNDGDDYFGRLSVAWEGGGAPGTRAKDILDPAGGTATVLTGTGSCAAPAITLNGPAVVAAGAQATFSITTAGTGPYTVRWDVDGDGIVDRTETNSNGSSTIAPVFPTATSTNVSVRVTNAANCEGSASRALNVTAPDLVATPSAPFQVCGDNDSAIEPGERWSIPVSIANSGGLALDGGYAIFARQLGGAAGTEYESTNSATNPNVCGFSFVDTNTSALSLTAASGGGGATDDGATPPLAAPNGFSLFGQPVTTLVMSTNGYLSTSSTDSGGDYDNACPVDAPDRGSNGSRLNVLHSDLVLQSGGSLRTQRFNTCPRASAVSPGVGCVVYTWSNLGLYQSSSSATGNAEFQAVLYDNTNEIVYQYRTADPAAGGDATIGVQNADVSRVVQPACNTPNAAPSNRAVCFFAPGQAPSALAAAPTRLLSPAVQLPNLASGQSANVNAVFQVAANAGCGSPLGLDYVGTVDSRAYSVRARSLLSTTVGAGGSCQVFTGACAAPPAEIAKRDGLYSSFLRLGNGMGAFNIPTPSGTVFGGQWYTGKPDRSPTWLTLQGPIVDNQADVNVYRFRRTSTTPFQAAGTVVGRAQISYVSPTDYVATWIVDGKAGGERLSIAYGTNRPTPNRTGSWYPPSEPGWGMAVDDHILNGQPDEVIVNYYYDAANDPIWTLGGGSPPGAGTQTQNLFRVHCPTCPSLPDFLNEVKSAGTVSYSYSSLTRGNYTTNISFPLPFSGTWLRNQIAIEMLSAPVPQ